jgi:thiamine phosphate synthase YjbQ (UPF0047 family)
MSELQSPRRPGGVPSSPGGEANDCFRAAKRWVHRHTPEGPGDMTPHIRTALTQKHLSIPIHAGYRIEHRSRPHRSSVVLHLLREG